MASGQALIENEVDESCEEVGRHPITIETMKGAGVLEVCSLAEIWVTVEGPPESHDSYDTVRIGAKGYPRRGGGGPNATGLHRKRRPRARSLRACPIGSRSTR